MSFKRSIISFFVIGIVGSISHFVYEWSGYNTIIGYIFPVNESVWEHLKLIFYPAIFYFIIEYFTISEKRRDYFPSSIFSLYHGMFAIIFLYYIITGIIGKNVDFLNILFYFVGIIILLLKQRKMYFSQRFNSNFYLKVSIATAVITAFLFGLWSYNPPSLGIFTPYSHP